MVLILTAIDIVFWLRGISENWMLIASVAQLLNQFFWHRCKGSKKINSTYAAYTFFLVHAVTANLWYHD
jgi:hypothetical protein